ncbi:RRP15-like protein [Hondaea fermentalgiana]|uniref:RRP15-like protein n=1 Tax=Hondaea fermentalgiana TaxID=2315210 RepID=A0A2R5GC61_9STRA|nr:RRP15-like protein [Hondaea fermentalgiana]|eukprot:GBG26173.1 RRP15-like protein [Hondaea fermentalgiana]
MSDRSARRRAREQARLKEAEALLQEEEKSAEDHADEDDDDVDEDQEEGEVQGEARGGGDVDSVSEGAEDDEGREEQEEEEAKGGDGENPQSKENGSFFAKTLLDLVQKPKKRSAADLDDASDDEDVDEDDKSDEEDSEEDSAGDGTTVLTKRKTKEMKENEKLRREARKRKRVRKAKREAREQGMEPPQAADIAFERQLRKIATKGVVMLFNTINTHQNKKRALTEDKNDSSKKKGINVKGASKDSFLDMLKQGATKKAPATSDVEDEEVDEDGPATEAGAGWGVMRDDYMIGAKLSDYGKAEAGEELDDDEGAEIESVSD